MLKRSSSNRRPRTVIGLFLSLSSCLLAVEPVKVLEQPLDELVVVAQEQTPSALDPSVGTFLPHQLKVIEIDDSMSPSMSLSDVLMQQTSVQIRSVGGEGSYQSISIRGSSGAQVHVILDGQLLNSASSSSVDLSKISISDLARIEIYKGSAPLEHGGAVMGGTLVLTSKVKAAERKTMLKLGLGSYGYQRLGLEQHWSHGVWRHLLMAESKRSDGDYNYVDDRTTINDLSDDVVRTRSNNALRQHRLHWGTHRALKNRGKVDVSLGALDKKRGLAGRGNQLTRGVHLKERELDTRIQWAQPDLFVSSSKTKLSFSNHWERDEYVDLQGVNGELGLGRQHERYTMDQQQLSLDQEQFVGDQVVHLRYQLRRESQDSENVLRSFDYPSSQRWTHDLGVQWELGVWGWILSPMLQYRHAQSDFSALTIIGQGQQKRSDSDLLGGMGFMRNLGEFVQIKANVHKAIRQPSFDELFGDRGNVAGAPDLRSEQVLNMDLGVEYTHHDSSIEDLSVFQSLVVFRKQRRDLIEYVFDSRGVGRAENISEGEVMGIELEQQLQWSWFTFSQQLTYLDAEISDSIYKNQIGKKIPSLYTTVYSPELSCSVGAYRFYIKGLGRDDMFYDRNNLIQAANHFKVDLGLSYQRSKFKVFVDVKNVNEEQIEDYSGWPQAGREYMFTLHTLF